LILLYDVFVYFGTTFSRFPSLSFKDMKYYCKNSRPTGAIFLTSNNF